MKCTLLVLACALCTLSARSQAVNNYYVDGSLASNGDGSAASPWNRIWYAVNRSPRDTTKDAVVYIKAGTYTITDADYLTQLYIGSANGGGGGKYLILRPYTSDEGKVIINGSGLTTTTFYPSMLTVSGASWVRLQNLVFRNLKNTNGQVLNIQSSQYVEVNNCVFDSLQWTTTSAEWGYPTVNNASNYIYPIYLLNNSSVSISADTLRNSAIGWGDMVRDGGGNTGLTTSGVVSTGNTGVASDYYVALTGNDTTGSGSVAKPWRTVSKALDLAGINYTVSPSKLISAPVTVNLRAGTHKPTGSGIYIGSNRGTNSQWFTIRNYPGENVILDGSSITAKFSALISIADAKYVRIQGLKLTKMTNDSSLTNVSPSVGSKDTRFGILVSGKASNIVIRGNDLYDMAWSRNTTAQKTPTASDNLNPLIVLGTTDTAIRNVIIDSNNIYNNVPGYSEAVTVNGNVDSFAVTNNYVYNNANIGIVAAGHYQWVVDDPNYTVTAASNYSRNGYIINNEVYKNISPVAVSAGIYLDGSSNITVEDNESYKNGVGISVGNEQSNSTSGGHLIQSNVFRDNLGAGVYYGSTNSTSMVQNCVMKWNTLQHNYTLDSSLRARANNQYGITDTTQRYTELNVYRLQNSTFEENETYSSSNIVNGFYYTQSGLTFRYNEYYVSSGSACNAIFVRDDNNNGGIDATDDIFTTFHQYAQQTGYDRSSSCEGVDYSSTGCGTSSLTTTDSQLAATVGTEAGAPGVKVFPNPVVNTVSVYITVAEAGTAQLQLFNMSGARIQTGRQQVQAGTNTVVWNNIKKVANASGVYLLKVTAPGVDKTVRLVIP